MTPRMSLSDRALCGNLGLSVVLSDRTAWFWRSPVLDFCWFEAPEGFNGSGLLSWSSARKKPRRAIPRQTSAFRVGRFPSSAFRVGRFHGSREGGICSVVLSCSRRRPRTRERESPRQHSPSGSFGCGLGEGIPARCSHRDPVGSGQPIRLLRRATRSAFLRGILMSPSALLRMEAASSSMLMSSGSRWMLATASVSFVPGSTVTPVP